MPWRRLYVRATATKSSSSRTTPPAAPRSWRSWTSFSSCIGVADDELVLDLAPAAAATAARDRRDAAGGPASRAST